MNEGELTSCVASIARAVGVPLGQSAKKRHAARLQKAEDRPVAQMDAQKAKAGLAARAMATGTLPNFHVAFDRLAPHSNARDNFTALLWKISQNPELMATLRPRDRAENRAISANQPKTAPSTDQLIQQQLRGKTPGRRIEVPAHRYAECEDGSVMESLSALNSLELNSPLETVPRPSPMPSSALAGGVFNNVDNPMFTQTNSVPGSPWVNSVYNTAEEPNVEVEARITLPDAGNLFSPMHEGLAASSPEHIMQKFQELPRYDGNLHLPCLTKKQRSHRGTRLPFGVVMQDDILYPAPAKETLKDVHPVVQEMMLANDLLDAFMDDGTKILELVPVRNEVGNTHHVYTLTAQNSQCCPDALCEQLQNLLRIAECVLLVGRYITSRNRPEYGAVCGAFADAVRDLLVDWKLYVTTLEKDLKGNALCAEAASHNAYGASLLNLLHSRAKTEAGNVSRTKVLRMLLKAASVPYFEVLTTWVSTGTLSDPCSEFMVVAVPGMNVDVELDGQSAFWVGGHKLRTVTAADGTEVSDVPMFLHAVEDEVLKAGKNWNILRQCQQAAASKGGGFDALEPSADQHIVEYDPADRFIQQIQQRYERASTALLTMMLSHFKLKDWLVSCKNFFLLHQGDYLTNFLDCADDELNKQVSTASMSLLRGQLEMAVKTSSLAHDIHSDKLQFVLDPSSFTDLHTALFDPKANSKKNAKNMEKMKAADLIMLELGVQWPISIVLTPHNMRAFQFCFRHLVNVKVVERKLGDKWRQLMDTRKLKRPANDAERHGHAVLWRLLALVNRMNTFIHRYLHFLTVEVIDPHWHEMMTKIDQASSIDEVIVLLTECLHKILEVGLLERLKTLSMVVIVLWRCRDCCAKVDAAVKKIYVVDVPPDQLTPEMLLKVAMQPDFEQSITLAEKDFTMAQTKLSKDLKTHKYSGVAGVTGASADSVADASKLLHQLLEVA